MSSAPSRPASRATVRRKRTGAQRSILAALAALAFLLGGVGAGLTAYVGAVTDAAVRDTLAEAPVQDRTYQVSARLVAEPDVQHQSLAAAFDRYVRDVPADLHRSLITEPRRLIDPDAPDSEVQLPRVILASFDGIEGHAELVAGDWPRPGTPEVAAVLHAEARDTLGVEIGDTLAFEERGEVAELEITGFWLPSDPDDGFWFAEALALDGSDERVEGFVVVAEDDLATLPGAAPFGRWRYVPDLSIVTAADLATLRLGLARVRGYLSGDTLLSGAGATVRDDIIAVLRGSDQRLLTARAVGVVPLVLLGVTAVAAIALIARLLGEIRLPESLVLRGRGWSVTQVVGWSLREATFAFVIPALLGGAVAWSLVRSDPTIGTEVSAVAAALGAIVAAVLGAATMTVVGAKAAAGSVSATVTRMAGSARAGLVAKSGAVVLVIAVAALALWQLRRYDGVTVADASGVPRIDPLAVIAPAAALLAGAVAVAAVMVVVGRVVEWLLARRRGLSGVMSARHRPAGHPTRPADGTDSRWADVHRGIAAQ